MENSLAVELLNKHFISTLLVIGFSMKLWSQRRAGDRHLWWYWLTVFSTMVLIVADSCELWAQGDPSRRFFRMFFSVVGYIMRPAAAMSIAMIVYPENRKPRLIWIPFVLNALVYCTAFFSPIAFFFKESDYTFVRGPLGYTVFSVCFFYIIFAVLTTWNRFRHEDHSGDRFVLYFCALACLAAALIDWQTEGANINPTIMISGIFLYMFLRFYDTDRDPLTGLRNRMSFYADCKRYGSLINAVASVDMNELKELNDTKGHEAGDKALQAIADSLKDVAGRRIMVYRIGGDEFIILFIRQDQIVVSDVMHRVKKMIADSGYSVSAGYTMRGGRDEAITEMVRVSDERMYADKAEYYRRIGRDRRTR